MIPDEAILHFENAIYLPMLVLIMERDRAQIEISALKFKSPYLKMVEQAIKLVQADLKNTNQYLRQKNMKLIKRATDGDFTEYAFINRGYEDRRRYFNVRLRNHTEELLEKYLREGMNKDGQKRTMHLRSY
ncbi:hypothetical protein ACXYMX_06870 [Sporosarcina sp. CAU 1771]